MQAFNHSYRFIERENSFGYGGNVNLQRTLERGRPQDPNCYFKKAKMQARRQWWMFLNSLNYVGWKGAAIKGGTGLSMLVWICSQGAPLTGMYEWRGIRLQQSSWQSMTGQLRYLLGSFSLSEQRSPVCMEDQVMFLFIWPSAYSKILLMHGIWEKTEKLRRNF